VLERRRLRQESRNLAFAFRGEITAILQEMVNLGEGVYSQLELDILLRIYRDTRKAIQLTVTQGEGILATITEKHEG
jgi:hypothetical protein